MQAERIVRWSARILASLTLLFALPFYFGYGNPLPFVDPAYTFFENLWLTVVPISLIGLAIGWRYELIGGLIVSVPIAIAFVIGIFSGEIVSAMIVPFACGVLYVVSSWMHAR